MAPADIITDAAEYNAATNRISSALQLLRNEMKSLRHQDLTLMRQLITINDSIKSLGQEQRSTKTVAKRQRNMTRHINPLKQTTLCQKRQTSLVCQQSLPRYFEAIPEVRERRGSMSSEDDSQDESMSDSLTSLDYDTGDRMSAENPVFQKPSFCRQRSRSMKEPTTSTPKEMANDSTNYETILVKNVQLRTQSQTVDSDSVLESDSEQKQSS